jgi:antitoxin component HigA of HigAB toxin-antitoxin module
MSRGIRPIRTEADYAAALSPVDELMRAERGTPAGDELNVLVTLIEAYEAPDEPGIFRPASFRRIEARPPGRSP